MRPVPAFQFPRQRLTASGLVVDNHGHRPGHGGNPKPARPYGRGGGGLAGFSGSLGLVGEPDTGQFGKQVAGLLRARL
jgi:hypothetical protein